MASQCCRYISRYLRRSTKDESLTVALFTVLWSPIGSSRAASFSKWVEECFDHVSFSTELVKISVILRFGIRGLN